MGKRAAGLTAKSVRTKGPGVHADGGGLYLKVLPSGARMWLYRYQIAGKRHDMGLGGVDVFTLSEARERALDARRQVARGMDPLADKRAQRVAAAISAAKSATFKECAEAYIEAHAPGWRHAQHAQQWPSSMERYVYPTIGDLPVRDIDVGLVLKVIEPIWLTKSETASRVRSRVEAVLDYAMTRGYRQGENPARWRGHLENLLPAKSKVAPVQHFAALPYIEMGSFMSELRGHDSIPARALKFAILTAARTDQVLGAKWSEIDIANRLWIVPASRMKSRREHRVPLSDAAMAIVEQMAAIRCNDFVFPGIKSDRLNARALQIALQRTGRTGLTPHGFRSTFSDWVAERTAYPAEVREMALAHAVGDKVEAAYRRGDLFDKRVRLMEDWERFCASPPIEGEVVPLRRVGVGQ